VYPRGMPLVDALQSEPLGLGLVGEGPPVFAQAARIPLVYLAAEAPAPEREAIIVHPDSPIRSVRELRGRKVMVSRGSNVHYFLILALEEAQLDYTDIEIVYVPPEHAAAEFQSRRVDAWATWDPFLGSARETVQARVLRDARGLTENTSYYIATRDFADQRRDLVHVFLNEVNAAARWARQHGPEALSLLASHRDGRHWSPTVFNGMLGAWPIDAGHLASQQAVADTFLRLKLIARPVAVAAAGWMFS
jgi:sulfonate transport system substrate-binding protein